MFVRLHSSMLAATWSLTWMRKTEIWNTIKTLGGNETHSWNLINCNSTSGHTAGLTLIIEVTDDRFHCIFIFSKNAKQIILLGSYDKRQT